LGSQSGRWLTTHPAGQSIPTIAATRERRLEITRRSHDASISRKSDVPHNDVQAQLHERRCSTQPHYGDGGRDFPHMSSIGDPQPGAARFQLRSLREKEIFLRLA
jgi:hypothetical protein